MYRKVLAFLLTVLVVIAIAVGAQRKADFRTEAAVHKDLRGQRQGQAE